MNSNYKKKIKNVAIVYRPGLKEALEKAAELGEWLQDKKIKLYSHPERKLKINKKLLPVIDELNGIMIVTADHGNADEMFTVKNGKKDVKTSHTLNPVPFVIYDPNDSHEYEIANVQKPSLTNIAGTILNLLGYQNVEDYDESLIKVS